MSAGEHDLEGLLGDGAVALAEVLLCVCACVKRGWGGAAVML